MEGRTVKNNVLILVYLGVLSITLTVFGQTLTNKPIFEAESIKVIANEKFPADLNCEVFVGPKGTPFFSTEGNQDRLKAVRLEFAGAGPVVSVVQKEVKTNSYALYLFTGDAEGFFDLNFDGIWDVKRTPTHAEKNFILFQGKWLAVDKINGLLSQQPSAEKDGKKYIFQETWKLSN